MRAEATTVDQIFDEVTQLGPEVLLNYSRGLDVSQSASAVVEPESIRDDARQEQ